jgi:hypothetical protein
MVEKKEAGVDSGNHEKHMQNPYGKKYRFFKMLNYVAQSVTSVLGMVTFNKDSCN